jgi:hypothetical protein
VGEAREEWVNPVFCSSSGVSGAGDLRDSSWSGTSQSARCDPSLLDLDIEVGSRPAQVEGPQVLD